MRDIDDNDKYAILRFALISQFSDDNFKADYDLEVGHFQSIYDFLKLLYYEHCKLKEDAQKL